MEFAFLLPLFKNNNFNNISFLKSQSPEAETLRRGYRMFHLRINIMSLLATIKNNYKFSNLLIIE